MNLRPAGQDLAALLDLYRSGLPGGSPTGWGSLDAHYTIAASQLSVVTGIPGHGKSSWLDALLIQLLDRPLGGKPWQFLICSPENWPVQTHEARLLARLTGRRFGAGLNRMTEDQMISGVAKLGQRFTFAELSESEIFPDLLQGAREFAAKHKSSQVGIVLDPWNQLEHCRPSNLTETEYVSYALSAAIRLTRATGAHLWIVAHPAKLMRDKTTGERPVPTPYDIAGSAHFYNKPDNCLCIWRKTGNETWSDEVDVHVQKVRFQHIGKIGKVTLHYDIATGRYRDDGNRQGYLESSRGGAEGIGLHRREPGED